MNKTSIHDLEFSEKQEESEEEINKLIIQLEEINIENLPKIIFDLETPLKYRLKSLEKYCKNCPDDSLSIVNRLNAMYTFSQSKILEEYLFQVCIDSTIEVYLKIECAKGLALGNEKGYIALNNICNRFNSLDIATPCKIDAICFLMEKNDYKLNSLKYFCDVINDSNIEPLYRYKCILSLKSKLKDEESAKFYTEKSCTSFISNLKNPITYRILACQYTIIFCNPSDELRGWIEEQLLLFAQDNVLDINVRADAADVLLQFGSENNRKLASEIIIFLGTNGARGRTVFDNAQNVHHKSIEESAIKILEFINTQQIKKEDGNDIDFDYVRKQILEKLDKDGDEKEYKEKVESALTRILIDRAVYSQYNMSLMNILVKIWNYIESHQYSEEMKRRLLDELHESAEVCSTGYAFRIVNVVSGYGDLSIQISYEDQIVGNLAGRLNSKVRELEDTDYQEMILAEMMVDPSKFEARGNFLKFFREHISKIREDMYQEFKEYISDSEYDLFFRKAIFQYEGMEY